ncbi:MAG: NosD domain-containing protein [Nitrososphaerota archaeon]|nr:right-handed parallel beta-helix repeat-containing protein [Candidatus Calditenuis fumarioli]
MPRNGFVLFLAVLTSLPLIQPALGATHPETPQFSDLQALIDSAEPYSTIWVAPGTYAGPIRVWKPLSLKAMGEVVIDGRGLGDVVVIASDDVRFEGFKVVNSFPDVAFEPAGIKVVNSRNVTIAGVRTERVIHSVYVVNSSRVTVMGSSLSSFPERSVNDRGHGVYLWYSRDVEVVGNAIEFVKDGVYSDHSYGVLVRGNAISRSRYGVHLMYSGKHVIERNEVRRNLVGMALMYSCGLEVRDNSVTENRGLAVSEGIFVRESCDVLIEVNRIVGNGVGLNVVNSPYPREGSVVVRGNVIAFNNVGVRFEVWASATFERNDLVENAHQVSILAVSTSALWRGNFWSDRGLQIGERHLVVSSIEDLLDRWPELWAFAYGPGYVALKMARALTELRPSVKAIDESPSRAPNVLNAVPTPRSTLWLLASIALTFSPLAAIVAVRRR